ncbi:uncharacterized protein METZ01_LOCUS172609, partial [marine metagenome]
VLVEMIVYWLMYLIPVYAALTPIRVDQKANSFLFGFFINEPTEIFLLWS